MLQYMNDNSQQFREVAMPNTPKTKHSAAGRLREFESLSESFFIVQKIIHVQYETD